MPGWGSLGILLISIFQVVQCGSETWDLITDEFFTFPGHINLGGLFSIHTKADIMYHRIQPGPLTCHSFSPQGFVEALAMKYAIEEINNSSSLLPGVRMGYEIHDTCMESLVILQSAMHFLGEGKSPTTQVLCNYTNYRTRVAAVIGPSTPEMVTATGKLLGFFLIPQISFAASCEKLSDKAVFPSFLRTVPSDKVQARGIVSLLKRLGWDWIAVLGSSDQYGEDGLYHFSLIANEDGICIAYEDYLPIDDSAATVNKSQKIIEKIRKANVNVVVLFSSQDQAQAFFAVALMAKLEMVWVASSSWSLSSTIRQMSGIENIGTVIGFAVKNQPIAGLESYVRNVLGLLAVQVKRPSNNHPAGTCDDGAEADYERQAFQNSCMECSTLTPANTSMIHDPMTQRLTHSIYTAVYSVAYALHNMFRCSSTRCQIDSYPYAWQLLKELKNINFTMRNSTFAFDENGNMDIGYDILTWTTDKNGMPFRTVGEYTGELTLDADQIQWHTKSQKPESTCLKQCDEGSIKIAKGSHSCCFDCIMCPKGTYANYTVFSGTCSPCPEGQWSEPGSTVCLPPTYLALTWTNNFVITLMAVKAFLVLIVLFVALLFLARRQTPLLQASGASLSILALAGLAAMCCSVFLFVAHPSDLICQLQQPFFAGALSTCLSSFLVKSLRIVACTSFPQKLGSCTHWLITHGGGLLVLLLLLVQVLFCTMFVRASPLLSNKLSAMDIRSLTISLNCSIDRIIEFSIMFGYNALLVLISFMCSFLSPKPVHQYNLARDITFAMLIFLSAWIVFIPCYASSTGQDKALIQAAIILFSCLGVLVAAFLPKCYILLFKPELNTPEFFATYLLRNLGQKDLGSERQVTQQ